LNVLAGLSERGVGPPRHPAVGGNLPDCVFTKILGLPAFVIPCTNADAANKNLNVDCSITAIKTGVALLAEIGA
jgi:hypothetical protein